MEEPGPVVERWISTEEAARRLGVKRETLYAYVSRGLLSSRRGPGSSGSLYSLADVEAFREAGSRQPASASKPFRFPVLTTRITDVTLDRLAYRGYDVRQLVGRHGFEEVCGLLWTGELAHEDLPAPAASEPARRALAALPADLDRRVRLRLAVSMLSAAADPARHDLSPDGVRASAAAAIGGMVALLGAQGGTSGPLANRLVQALGVEDVQPTVVTAVDAALVLLADRGLAASTVAARTAASVRADPYAVIAAGLACLEGPAHGAGGTAAHRALLDVLDRAGTTEESHEAPFSELGTPDVSVPVADPRATALLGLLADSGRNASALAAAAALLAVDGASRSPHPSVELALAVLCVGADLPVGSGDVLLAVARSAGWVAHALEEYAEQPLRWRANELYVGPAPRPAP